MNKKRTMSTILAATVAVGALAGCGSSSGNNNSSPATGSSSSTGSTGSGTSGSAETKELYTPVGQMPIVNERIQLKIFAPGDGERSRDGNLQTKELEEMTNIDIVWDVAPTDNIRDKMNLLFASGDIPDIVMTGVGNSSRLDKATEALLGAQGLIIPLNEYFDTLSVGYKNAFEQLEGMREFITTPDGNIYNLPNVDGSLHVQYNNKLWLNTHWLDNLGLQMPTTTDEFYQVMKAFKEQDANGNGDPNDEIPLSTVISGAGTQIDGFLMDPFQLTPEATRLYVDQGKVTFSPIQEGYKEGLRFLNKMYAEGLVNPESFTQDLNNQVNVNENGEKAVIGAFLAQRPGYAADLRSEPNSKKWEQYQPIPPLKGPSGQVIAAWNPYVMYQTGMVFITSNCEYPEAAFRLIDYLATPEGTRRSAHGIEGVHWRQATADEMGMDGKPALITTIPGTDALGDNATWNQLAGLVRLPQATVSITTNQNPYAEDVPPLAGRQIIMYKGSLEHEKVRQPLESVLPDLYMAQDDVEEMALLKTTIMDYHKEALVRFITGDFQIDKDWDRYVQQLNSIGLDRYLELLQKAYDNSSFSN